MGNICKATGDEQPPKQREKKEEIKLLLLGSGESGKSTIFKQIKILFVNGFDEEEVEHYKSSIYANIIQTMKILSEICFKNDYKFEKSESEAYARKIMSIAENDTALLLNASKKYTPEVADMIAYLWEDSAIKNAFTKRYEYHVFDGALYFLENLKRFRPENDYRPTNEDILHCRMKTTGIVECTFELGDRKFKLIDVGGQRNERKKWIHCFEGVTAVMFVAGLGDYDQKCYEDDITNRMTESMDLFDEVVNGTWFKEKPIILVFNKTDIFEQKIAETDLSVCFEDYQGGKNAEVAKKFIEEKFKDVNTYDPNRIHVHYTCATNEDSIKRVMNELLKLFNSLSENKTA